MATFSAGPFFYFVLVTDFPLSVADVSSRLDVRDGEREREEQFERNEPGGRKTEAINRAAVNVSRWPGRRRPIKKKVSAAILELGWPSKNNNIDRFKTPAAVSAAAEDVFHSADLSSAPEWGDWVGGGGGAIWSSKMAA